MSKTSITRYRKDTRMKPYIKKIAPLRQTDGVYRLFFKDKYGNLYGGTQSFETWCEALKYGIKECSYGGIKVK